MYRLCKTNLYSYVREGHDHPLCRVLPGRMNMQMRSLASWNCGWRDVMRPDKETVPYDRCKSSEGEIAEGLRGAGWETD